MSDVSDSSAAPVVEAGQEGQEVAEPVVPAKNMRKIKYRADGKDYEDEIDFNDDKVMAQHLSKSRAASKRMDESAATKRQAEQFFKMLQDDPEKLLSHEQFGGPKKLREFAERLLSRQLEEEMLTPQERQQKTNEERLKKYEDQEKEQVTRQEQEHMQKLQEHYADDFQKQIITGLSSQGLPKTNRTVKRMAALMSKNLEHGFDMTPQQLAEIVRSDYEEEMREMFGASDGDMLLKLIGEEGSSKIRKSDLARLKSNSPFGQQPQQRSAPTQDEPPRKMSPRQHDEWLRNKIKGT